MCVYSRRWHACTSVHLFLWTLRIESEINAYSVNSTVAFIFLILLLINFKSCIKVNQCWKWINKNNSYLRWGGIMPGPLQSWIGFNDCCKYITVWRSLSLGFSLPQAFPPFFSCSFCWSLSLTPLVRHGNPFIEFSLYVPPRLSFFVNHLFMFFLIMSTG